MTRDLGRRKATWIAAAALLALGACSSKDVATTTTYTREQLMDPETCKECHAEHYKEWSGSMHAYAATDPVFIAMNARGQRETKGELGTFCVNCHAPLAVQEHAADGGTDLSSIPKKLQGVTCYFCHQVTDVQGTHNNPLVLANDTTMRGGIGDPAPNPAHTGQYSKLHDGNLLDSSKMCGSCHDIVVPGHFSGAKEDVHLERTYAEWQKSLFASVEESHGATAACAASGCHMPTERNVPVASRAGLSVPTRDARHKHEFAGVDLALVDAFPEKDAQRQAVQALLEPSMAVKLCVNNQTTGEALVTLENLSAAHNIPSGASQDRRMWVDFRAFDSTGEEIFSSGKVPDGTNVTDLDDPNLWLLRDRTLDKDGNPAHMFWEVASIDPTPNSGKPTIPAPETLKMVDAPPDRTYHTEQVYRTYRIYAASKNMPARVELVFRVQPVGRDVLDELVTSGDLAAEVRDAMTTIDLIPNRGDGGVMTTLTWSASLPRSAVTREGASTCVQTQPLR